MREDIIVEVKSISFIIINNSSNNNNLTVVHKLTSFRLLA